ncbi:hypothetical protein EB74_04640 [Mycobacterium sp. SWH-M5]|nr:hypothetical protein EB74_04640 [Mycobacterium sp. SWH-M5]
MESEQRIKLDSSAITRIENGAREPRLSEAIAIADLLGFPLSIGGLVENIGGEPQFAKAETRLKRDLALARRRIINACIDIHIAFDGIFGTEEEVVILGRRGSRNAIEWAEKFRDAMIQWFSVGEDEAGSFNYVMVDDPERRQVLEIVLSSLTANLYKTEQEILDYTREEQDKVRAILIESARSTLEEVFGRDEFKARFGEAFDDPSA